MNNSTFPIPPNYQINVIPQTKVDKKNAKLMEELLNYMWDQGLNLKSVRTLWGILTWTPKNY